MAKNKSGGGNHYSYHNANGGPKNPDDPDFISGDGCCGVVCLKFTIHLFNVIFFLTGLILVAVGIWTLLEKHPSLALLTSGLYDLTGYILVIAGCIILFTTVVGCCGLSRNSHKTVLTYAVLLGVIFVIEASAGILAYLYRGKLTSELTSNLHDKFAVEYGTDPDTTTAVDHLQQTLACCGINSFEDWHDTEWWSHPQRRNNKVPDSCCITLGLYCGVRDHPSNIRYTGCIDRIAAIAGDHLIIVGAVALGICLIQLLGTILACFLHCKLKDLTRHYG